MYTPSDAPLRAEGAHPTPTAKPWGHVIIITHLEKCGFPYEMGDVLKIVEIVP